MFITRATRHDKEDIREFVQSEWPEDEADVNRGTSFIAREGKVIGHVRLIEVAPQKLVVDEVVVDKDRRGEGIGRNLMEAAMNSRGGTLYLCCHEPHIPFYGRFGFEQVPFEELPDEVRAHHEAEGEWPTQQGHDHFFMKAR